MAEAGLFSIDTWATNNEEPDALEAQSEGGSKMSTQKKRRAAKGGQTVLFQYEDDDQIEMVFNTKRCETTLQGAGEEACAKRSPEEEISFDLEESPEDSYPVDGPANGPDSQRKRRRSLNEATLALLKSQDSKFSHFSGYRSRSYSSEFGPTSSFSSAEFSSMSTFSESQQWFDYMVQSASASESSVDESSLESSFSDVSQEVPQEITSTNGGVSAHEEISLVPSENSVESGYSGESETTVDTGVLDMPTKDSVKGLISSEGIFSGYCCPLDLSSVQPKTTQGKSLALLLSHSASEVPKELQRPSLPSTEPSDHVDENAVNNATEKTPSKAQSARSNLLGSGSESKSPNDEVLRRVFSLQQWSPLALRELFRESPHIQSDGMAPSIELKNPGDGLEIDVTKTTSKDISPLSNPESVEIRSRDCKDTKHVPSVPMPTENTVPIESDKYVDLKFKQDLVVLCTSMQKQVTEATDGDNSQKQVTEATDGDNSQKQVTEATDGDNSQKQVTEATDGDNSQEYHSCITNLERDYPQGESFHTMTSEGHAPSKYEMKNSANPIAEQALLHKKACMEELTECFEEAQLETEDSPSKPDHEIWVGPDVEGNQSVRDSISSLEGNHSVDDRLFQSDSEQERNTGIAADCRIEYPNSSVVDSALWSGFDWQDDSKASSTQNAVRHPLEAHHLYHTKARINKDANIAELRECFEEALMQQQDSMGQNDRNGSSPVESTPFTTEDEMVMVSSWKEEGSFGARPSLSNSNTSMDSLDIDVLKAIKDYDAAKAQEKVVSLQPPDDLPAAQTLVQADVEKQKEQCRLELSDCLLVATRRNMEACLFEFQKLVETTRRDDAPTTLPAPNQDAFVRDLLFWIDQTYFPGSRKKDDMEEFAGNGCLCTIHTEEKKPIPDYETSHLGLLELLRQQSLKRRNSILFIQRNIRRFLAQLRYHRVKEAACRIQRRWLMIRLPKTDEGLKKKVLASHRKQVRRNKDKCLGDILSQVPFHLQAKDQCRALMSSCLSALLERHFDTCLAKIRKDACMMELLGLIHEAQSVDHDWLVGEVVSFVEDTTALC